jgi:hypothetical protein
MLQGSLRKRELGKMQELQKGIQSMDIVKKIILTSIAFFLGVSILLLISPIFIAELVVYGKVSI